MLPNFPCAPAHVGYFSMPAKRVERFSTKGPSSTMSLSLSAKLAVGASSPSIPTVDHQMMLLGALAPFTYFTCC